METANLLSHSQWRLLNRRLIWAYSGAPAPCYREANGNQADYASAKCFQRGHGEYTINGVTHHCRPGEWLFLPPGGRYHQRLSVDALHLSIRFCLHWPSGLPVFAHDRILTSTAADFPKFTALGARLCAKRRDSGPDPSRAYNRRSLTLPQYLTSELLFEKWLVAYAEVMQALGVAPQPQPALDARLLEAIRLAEGQIRRGPMPVAVLARQSGLNENHMGRLFRKALGVSPSEFLDRQRLQSVIQAVAHERQTLKEVAFRFHFGSPQHFSRWFKRMTGEAPRLYFNRRSGSAYGN